MYLLVRLFFLFFLGDAVDFFFLSPAFFFLFLHLVVVVVGYAKPCWTDENARISMLLFVHMAAVLTTAIFMCSMELMLML